MTPSFDPPRIASGRADAPAALRDALQAAASDGPTPLQIEQLSSSLAPMFALPPSAALSAANGATQSATAGAKVLGAGKAVTTLGLVAVLAAGGYGVWLGSQPSQGNTENTAPTALVHPAPATPAPEPIPVEQLPLDTEPVMAGAAAPAKPRESTRARPVEPPPQEAPAAEAPKVPLSESELVDLARRSVATDPRKALALAQDHHRRFVGGPLSEEADFIEIEAMKRLGRFEEARVLDDRFRKRYPTSIHGQTVQVRPAPSP